MADYDLIEVPCNNLNCVAKHYIPKLYMCGVAWQEDLRASKEGYGFAKVYRSVKALKKAESCWKECGIVTLSLCNVRWAVKLNLGTK